MKTTVKSNVRNITPSNGKAKPANNFGVPAAKPGQEQENTGPVGACKFETNEAGQIVITLDCVEPTLSKSGKSYRVAALPFGNTDTGIALDDGRTIQFGRGVFYVKA